MYAIIDLIGRRAGRAGECSIGTGFDRALADRLHGSRPGHVTLG